jgi:Pyruvate/2-oxoacid:ferredoxin oxidoreductase delta subunit
MIIVICDCDNKQRASALQQTCVETGCRVVLAPSLYHIPEKSLLWKQLSEIGPDAAIWSALHPRPAKWLLHRHGIHAAVYRYDAYDSLEACFEAMGLNAGDASAMAVSGSVDEWTEETSAGPTKERWHPVVDKDLCNNCGQCFQFCLFGVYMRDDAQNVTVRNPDSCKPGCPACSRVCPKGAILFPLYAEDPAISGAPGFTMSPDKSARRMFYMRTKQSCPVCKTIPSGAEPQKGKTCPECGSAYNKPKSVIQDDIDSLIDALDAGL